MLTIRASAAPRAMSAPCSVLAPGARIDAENIAALNGTAVHAVLARLVTVGEIDHDGIPAVCARFGADAEEVRVLASQGASIWRVREPDYPAPMAEVAMSAEAVGLRITGTADVVSVRSDGVAYCLDWKSSRSDTSYEPQMMVYAALIVATWPSVHTVRCEVAWMRDAEVESFVYRPDDLRVRVAELRDRLVNWTGTYTTGPTCRWCSLAHSCEARRALVRADARALVDLNADLATMPAADMIRLYEAAQRVTDAADRLRAAARERAANAPIEADGKVLALREVNGARDVDVPKAWPVLDAHGLLDEAAVGEVLTVRLGAAEKVLKARAPKGKGAAAIREFNASLDAAGAIQRTTVQKLELRRAAPSVEETT